VLVRACRVDEVEEGKGRYLEVLGECIAVFREGGRFRALENQCPHQGAALAGGEMRGGAVHCPIHAWPFDADTGACLERPEVSVRTYPVQVRGGEVWVEI
jgi:nitrite reductase (NADH) small subunit